MTMPQDSCTRGHGASKSSQDPKTVDYIPRKRPEKLEIMSFETVDYSLGKRPEILEIASYDDAAGIMYRGSRGIEILPGPKNRGL